jgi:hypothetical protein
MRLTARVLLTLTAAVFGLSVGRGGAQPPLRLYVLDGGVLQSDPGRYQLTKEDVGITELAVARISYVQERTMDRYPTFEFNVEQTRAARKDLEVFLAPRPHSGFTMTSARTAGSRKRLSSTSRGAAEECAGELVLVVSRSRLRDGNIIVLPCRPSRSNSTKRVPRA